ncbi:MAG TPA: hypothetical protein VG734_07270 [Lacunisphaera sp.]|nr:hypothetical protein [Lacunisphaera sp.]
MPLLILSWVITFIVCLWSASVVYSIKSARPPAPTNGSSISDVPTEIQRSLASIPPRQYFWSAIANLATALFAGVGICGFLAQQRAGRLHEQLNELALLIEGANEDEQESIWLEEAEVRKRWEEMLKAINADVEKGADRLVRLNARSKRELERLLDDLHRIDAKTILHNLGYAKEGEPKPPTSRERALSRLVEYQKRVGILSFFEKP